MSFGEVNYETEGDFERGNIEKCAFLKKYSARTERKKLFRLWNVLGRQIDKYKAISSIGKNTR